MLSNIRDCVCAFCAAVLIPPGKTQQGALDIRRDVCAPSTQLFPYHLASYVCQALRITPFKYYCDLLFSVMREEKSYDFIPNFTVGMRSAW